MLYALRNWLILLGVKVSVDGELWKDFGIEEECTDANVIIIDKECRWLDDLYSEYTDWLSEYRLKLEKWLIKPYVGENIQRGRILVFVPHEACFVDSNSPLIFNGFSQEMGWYFLFAIVRPLYLWLSKT